MLMRSFLGGAMQGEVKQIISESNKKIVVIGDPHGNIRGLRQLMENIGDAFYLSVGDVAVFSSRTKLIADKRAWRHTENYEITDRIVAKTFQPLKYPLYSLFGNHDQYEDLEILAEVCNIHYLNNGNVYQFGELTFGVMGGVYSNKYHTYKREDLRGNKNQAFTQEEYNRLLSQEYDVLLTHQASEVYTPGGLPLRGCRLINTLVEAARSYHIHGHDHRSYLSTYKDKTIIGLSTFLHHSDAYYIINS